MRDVAFVRSKLYRLFEPFGGVAAYVRDQRLSVAFTTLLSPRERHRSIANIAFEWGSTTNPTSAKLGVGFEYQLPSTVACDNRLLALLPNSRDGNEYLALLVG